MLCHAEVTGLYDRAGDADKLLYAPLAKALTYRETRHYTLEFGGDAGELRQFLNRVLADETSHALVIGDAPAIQGAAFYLDYGMKPGALDLEREAILSYYRGLPQPGFQITSLKIQRRIYVFGTIAGDDRQSLAERFVRDIVNPAIHHHAVHAA